MQSGRLRVFAKVETASIIVYEWHQVLDTDRHSRHYTERPTGDGIPPRHIESLRFLREEINNAGNTAEIIICSHIERSQANLENLLYHTEISNLPVRDILITEQRYGEAGKLSACQALSSGLAFLYDDNPEVISEFWGSGQVAFQVRKPCAHRSLLRISSTTGLVLKPRLLFEPFHWQKIPVRHFVCRLPS